MVGKTDCSDCDCQGHEPEAGHPVIRLCPRHAQVEELVDFIAMYLRRRNDRAFDDKWAEFDDYARNLLAAAGGSAEKEGH